MIVWWTRIVSKMRIFFNHCFCVCNLTRSGQADTQEENREFNMRTETGPHMVKWFDPKRQNKGPRTKVQLWHFRQGRSILFCPQGRYWATKNVSPLILITCFGCIDCGWEQYKDVWWYMIGSLVRSFHSANQNKSVSS